RSRRGGVRVPGIRRRARALLAACRPVPAEESAALAARIAAEAARAIRRRAAAVGAALRGLRVGRARGVHHLRLAVKKYGSQMELRARSGLAAPGSALETARRVQESLGRLHDLDVLLGILRRRRTGRGLIKPLGRVRRARAAEARGVLARFRPWRPS